MINREINLISYLCCFIFTANHLWPQQAIPLINKMEKPIILYILAEIIIGMWIEVNNTRANNIILNKSNVKPELSVDKLIEFYHSIDFQKASSNFFDMTSKLCEHISTITGVDSTFVWLSPQEGIKGSIQMTPYNKLLEEKIANELGKAWNDLRNEEEATFVRLVHSWYYLAPVKTKTNFYGFIGIFWDSTANDESKARLLQNVRVVAEWSAIIYERVHTENMTAKSMIEMEQKRIGDEIHDLISGRLFSAVCATSVLMRSAKVDEKDKEQLQLIASTVNQALSELRSIIHVLKKTPNEQWFERQIKRYLDIVAKLHGISVSLLIKEEFANIERQHARALYRIICEAASNAVEHGHCKNLSIELMNKRSELHLTIIDDGIGFEPVNSAGEQHGLGLTNITCLAHSMNAISSIESHMGRGTRIKIIVPNEQTKITTVKTFEEVVS
ncbi:sensor histidine kinase [Desulfosporosinus sp. BG]|nr:sensor histidine kinase [Desulfosporosinus sp. BG]